MINAKVKCMKALRIISISMILLLLSGCGEEEIQSTWACSSVIIDGQLKEWSDGSLTHFDDKRLALGAQNDSAYLYLAAQIADEKLQRLVTMGGITLWIDPSGRKNKDLEMHLPAWQRGALDPSRGGFWQVMSDDQKAKAQIQIEEMCGGVLIVDKQSIQSRAFPKGSTSGFAGAMSISGGILSFEIRIPIHIQEYFSNYTALGTKSKVGITLGRSRTAGLAESGPMPGGSMGPAGTRGNGERRGGKPEREDLSSANSSEIWIEVSLATSK